MQKPSANSKGTLPQNKEEKAQTQTQTHSMFLSQEDQADKATILTTNPHFLWASQIHIVHQVWATIHTTQVNINSLLIFVYLSVHQGKRLLYCKVQGLRLFTNPKENDWI